MARKSKTNELSQRERLILEKHTELFHSCPDPILVISRRGDILTVNRRAAEFFRKTDADMCTRTVYDFFSVESRAHLRELSSNGWSHFGERRLVLLDGRIVSLNGSSIWGEQGVQFLLTFRDESTSVALQDARELQKQMEAVRRLSSLVATDLNDSISIVQGRMELMLELAQHEAENRHMSIALEHASRIAATLDNLRLVGRTGLSRLHAVSLDTVFEQAIALIGPRAVRRNIQADFTDIWIGGLRAAYARVFANLLGYVLDTVRADDQVVVRAFSKGSDQVTIQMYGGPAVVSFDQLLAVPVKAVGGAAQSESFALDVARMLIEQFGGTLEEWRAGKSVIVKMTVPSMSNDHVTARDVDTRILFVGEGRSREALCDWIGLTRHQMDLVPSAELALDRLESGQSFDALITELFLPGLSGMALAQRLTVSESGFAGRIVILAEAPVTTSLAGVEILSPPWSHSALLRALGVAEH